jgi:hypothetical protein
LTIQIGTSITTSHGDAPSRRRGSVALKRATSSLFLLIVIALLLVYWSGDRNADWNAYRLIFESGAWLFNQGRDTGFLDLIKLFKIFLPENYDLFRGLVGAYFIGWSAWLIWFFERRSQTQANLYALSYVGLLPLAVPRFTTQIREGVAVTLVLCALGFLQRPDGDRLAMWIVVAITVVILGLASAVHSGMAIFAAILLVSVGLCGAAHILPSRPRVVLASGIGITLLAFAALYISGVFDVMVFQLGEELNGGPLGPAVQGSTEKYFFWSATSLIAVYIAMMVRRSVREGNPQTLYSWVLRYMAYAVVPVLQALIFLLLISGYPVVTTSSAIRLYESVLFMTLALVSFSARKTWLLVAIVTILLINEHRVLLAAVAG